MALYQVNLFSVVGADPSNPLVNTFFYNVDDIFPSSLVASLLADEFYDIVVDGTGGWKAIIQLSTEATLIEVTSPFSSTALGLKPVSLLGLRSGTVMPRFVAWGFKSERTVANIRAGFKRFGRISETDTSGEVPTAGMLTILNTFADVMSLQLALTDGFSVYKADPVIVKRIPIVVGGETVGYRLPENDAELEVSLADNWAFQSITTQNSRKR